MHKKVVKENSVTCIIARFGDAFRLAILICKSVKIPRMSELAPTVCSRRICFPGQVSDDHNFSLTYTYTSRKYFPHFRSVLHATT